MKRPTTNSQRGVALFFSMLALLLLTAIGATLIFMASTETSVNSNYRQEQIAYFGAKAGLEEARARMMASDPGSIVCGSTSASGATCGAPVTGNANYPLFDPAQIAVPSASNHMIYYILNPGATAGSVAPWDNSNNSTKYPDDELCHDGYGTAFGTVMPPDVRCDPTKLPAAGWYESYNSTLPYNGTSSALSYEWVRIAPKVNGTISYLSGSGSTATAKQYLVNSGVSASQPVCFDGVEEIALPVGTGSCSAMKDNNATAMTNVYTVTSLGVSPIGARKMIQADMGIQPTSPFPDGMYATSTACPGAISFSGGTKLTVDSYTVSGGKQNIVDTGGNIGAAGQVDISNGTVYGDINVLAPSAACPTPVTGGGTFLGTAACPSGNAAQCYLTSLPSFSPPPIPNTYNGQAVSACSSGSGLSGDCMSQGVMYGNISESGNSTLYLQGGGTYYVNSLSVTGKAQIVVSPPGAVTLFIGGCSAAPPTGSTTCPQMASSSYVLDAEGNGLVNGGAKGASIDYSANDFTIDYGGNGSIAMGGDGVITGVLYAPLASLTLHGGGNGKGSLNGAIIANTIGMKGTEIFNYDQNTQTAPSNNGYFTMIGYRNVPY